MYNEARPQQKLPSKYKKDWQQADPLGKFILEKLIENDLTKNDLARELEIDRARLSAIFHGNSPLTGEQMATIARFLRVSLLDLLMYVVADHRQADIIYLVDTFLRLSKEDQELVQSIFEIFRKRLPAGSESPRDLLSNDLLSRMSRRRKIGDEGDLEDEGEEEEDE